jgi:hypothetical protein
VILLDFLLHFSGSLCPPKKSGTGLKITFPPHFCQEKSGTGGEKSKKKWHWAFQLQLFGTGREKVALGHFQRDFWHWPPLGADGRLSSAAMKGGGKSA